MTGRLAFTADAVPYYQHIKFFVDNLMNGTYPFWDPTTNSGVPNEFFLRRIGSFNPFFMIIVGLRKIGLPYLIAYNLYLSIYYLVGAIGFYKLSKTIFKDGYAAYFSFLILYFSSLGTRMYDSYLILVFVPLVWFFYFLISFLQNPRRCSLLGITFCLMNLATTYIPLYFLVIFASVVLFAVPIYLKETSQSLKLCVLFAWKNKWLSGICLTALLCSLVPGIMIFKSADKSEFVITSRSATAHSTHSLEVGKKDIVEWGMPEELLYSQAFLNPNNFKLAIIYFPPFLYLVLLLGILTRINRKLFALFCFGVFIFLVSSPDLSPLYNYFYQYVPIFKYFRNLHWFFWMALLAIFVLFATGQFSQLVQRRVESSKAKIGYLFFLLIVHVGYGVCVYRSGNAYFLTYLIILFSFSFFVAHIFNIFSNRHNWKYFVLTVIVLIPAVEMYHYLDLNSQKRKGPYIGDISFDAYAFLAGEKPEYQDDGSPASIYYALRNYYNIYFNVEPKAFYDYKNNRFVIYNHAEYMDLGAQDFSKINQMMKLNKDVAYIHVDAKIPSQDQPGTENYYVPTENTSTFNILKADVNSISVKTNFDQSKFLVFNNVFYKYWNVAIDGKKQMIIPTNIAFQGVMVPEGAHNITFKYGSTLYRWFNYVLMFASYSIFLMMVLTWIKDRQRRENAAMDNA
ncbi:MAG: hypothetical protein KBD53_07060 [Candidatus Omnitrophica bacterium]|nr:hypothetical protein [Candidatus Omnitrophota bacterium]